MCPWISNKIHIFVQIIDRNENNYNFNSADLCHFYYIVCLFDGV